MTEPNDEDDRIMGNEVKRDTMAMNTNCGVEEVKVEIYQDPTFTTNTTPMQKVPLISYKPRSTPSAAKGGYKSKPTVLPAKREVRDASKDQLNSWRQTLLSEGQVCCPFPNCELSYCSVRGLMLHYQICDGTRDDAEVIKCKICRKFVSCRISLAHHNRLLHRGNATKSVNLFVSSSNSTSTKKPGRITKSRRRVRKPVRYRDNEELKGCEFEDESAMEEPSQALELFSLLHKKELDSASEVEVMEEFKKSSFLRNMGLKRKQLEDGDEDNKDNASCEENGSSSLEDKALLQSVEEELAKSLILTANVTEAPRRRGRPKKIKPNEEDSSKKSNHTESKPNQRTLTGEHKELPALLGFDFINKEGKRSGCTTCGVCRKEFTNTTLFYHHILVIHNGLARPADCDQTFTEDERHEVLKRTFKKLGKLICPQEGCRKPLISFPGFIHHMNKCTKNSKTLGAEVCEEMLLDKNKKRMLQQMIRRDGKLICPNADCHKSLLTITGYIIHMKNCKPQDGASQEESPKNNILPELQAPITVSENFITCGQCASVFRQLDQFNHHAMANHNGLARPISESQEFTSDERASILKETFRVHKKLRCMQADCNKVFISLGGYLYHEKQCGQENLLVECSICAKKVKEYSLKYHMKTVHVPSPPDELEIPDNRKRKAATKAREIVQQLARVMDRDDVPVGKNDNLDVDSNYSGSEDNDDDEPAPAALYTKAPTPFVSTALFSEWREELEKNNKIVCKFEGCNESFSAPWQMCTHYKTCESGPYSVGYVCNQCGKKMKNEAKMQSHIRAHDRGGSGSDDEQGDKGYSLGHSHGKTRDNSFGPLTRAAQWTYQFQKENYSEELFEKWKPLKENWLPLFEEESALYTPETKESIAFKTSLCSVAGVTSSAWEKSKIFDSASMDEGDESATVFTGGPVSALAWCPTTNQSFADQFLAVATHLKMDKCATSIDATSGPGLIQIWSLEDVECQSSLSFHFCFGIAHDYGSVWQLQWCPSGCWEDPERESEERFLPRLGLLAAACSSGDIIIYSVPHFCTPLLERKSALYKPTPTIRLQVSPFIASPFQSGISSQCLCLSWLSSKGHDQIAGGFANGYIAIWHLDTESSLLNKMENTTSVLSAFHSHQAHAFGVQSVDWGSIYNGQYLASVGSDRKLHIWCSKDFSMPYIVRNGYGRFTKVCWPLHWSGLFVAFDDCYNLGRNSLVFMENGYFGNSRKVLINHNACIWDFAQSDWLNCGISCDSAGEVVGTVLGYLYNISHIKYLNRNRFPVYRIIMESLDANELNVERNHDTNDNGKDLNMLECIPEKPVDDGKSSAEVVDCGASSKADEAACKKKNGETNDKSDGGEFVKSVQDATKKLKPSVHKIASYEEAKCKYGIHFCDSLQATKKGWSSMESDRLVNPSTMTSSPPDAYPIASVNKVAWNPNLGSHLLIASGGQSGLLRIHTLQWLEHPLLRNIQMNYSDDVS